MPKLSELKEAEVPPCNVEPLSLLAAGNQFNKYLRTAAKKGVGRGRTRMNVCIINLTLSPSLSFSRRTIAVKFPCWQAKRSRSRGRKEVETYKARMNSAFAAFFLPFLPKSRVGQIPSAKDLMIHSFLQLKPWKMICFLKENIMTQGSTVKGS